MFAWQAAVVKVASCRLAAAQAVSVRRPEVACSSFLLRFRSVAGVRIGEASIPTKVFFTLLLPPAFFSLRGDEGARFYSWVAIPYKEKELEFFTLFLALSKNDPIYPSVMYP